MTDKYEKLDSLEDDEAIMELDKMIAKNDKVLAEDDLSILVEQEEKIVYYEIENVFKDPDTKAYRSRLKMRKNPPVLVVKDSSDNEVRFALTENLTDDMLESLNEVKRAYYGFASMERKDLPDKFIDRMGLYFKEEPVKMLLTVMGIAFALFIVIKGILR